MKHWKVITIGILGLLLFPLLAWATQITIPSAPGSGYFWVSTSTGAAIYTPFSTTSASCSGNTTCSSFTVLGSSPITISSSGGSGGSGNVSTSTHETAGGIAYWTSNSATPALLGEVATSTLTPASPLTGSFVQIGSSGSLGCQTASGSQAGCLSSTDWTTFNNKQSALTFNYPLSNSGGTVSVVATSTTQLPLFFATSSNAYAINQSSGSVSGYLSSTDWTTFNGKQANLSLLAGTYSNGDVCTYASSGTLLNCNTALPTGTVTSVTASAPLFSSGGATPNITWAGLATTTNLVAAQVLFATSASGVGGNTAFTFSTTGNTLLTVSNASTTNLATTNFWVGSSQLVGNGGTWTFPLASATAVGGNGNAGYISVWTATDLIGYYSPLTYNGTGSLLTVPNASTTNLTAGTYFADNALTNGDCVQAGANGVLTSAAAACGTGTVTSVGLSDSNSTLTIGSTPVTTSGTITATLNLAHSNTWSALQNFGNATSTLFTCTTCWATNVYVSGNVGIASTTPFSAFSVGSGTASSSITVAEYKYGAGSNAATSTTMNLDCNAGNQLAVPILGSAMTFTLINMTPGKSCRVIVQNGNTTASTVTWKVQAGIIVWTGGTAPTQTTTANKDDVYSFITTAGSSTMETLGAVSQNF